MGRWRQRGLAWMMAKGTARYELMVESRKRSLFAGASGTVVEIGAGTGPNLRYLAGSASYLAIEPNPYMHPHLEAELQKRNLRGSIEAVPAEIALGRMPEASVDSIISTLVLCSVNDPARLLDLARRVLRPGGKLLLLEHVGAARKSPLCLCQKLAAPGFHFFGDGCRPTRDTGSLVRAAGFRDVALEEFALPLGPISPHICGWATK